MSKKLFVVVLGLQAIIQMSQDATEKFKYALLVAGIIVFYKILQFLIDRKKNSLENNNAKNDKTKSD